MLPERILHVLEIQAGVEHKHELLLQFLRVFPHTAVQVYKVAVEVVVYLKVLAGRLMKQYPATTAEYFDVSLIIQRETGEDLVPERLFAADPGHETVDRITPFRL